MSTPADARDPENFSADAGVAVPGNEPVATGPNPVAPAAPEASAASPADHKDTVDLDREPDAAPRRAAAEHESAVSRWRARNDKRTKKKRPWWIELPLLLVTAFVLTFVIQTFLFKVYYVPSGSMEPTLHGVESGGDRILVNKIVYTFGEPAPGDVVVFKGPPSWAPEANIPGPTSWLGKLGQAVGSVVGIAPPNEKDFVKRVIAVGGQTVQCCDAQGNVQVDGKTIHEPYINGQGLPFEPGVNDCTSGGDQPGAELMNSQRCFGPFVVPQGTVWVMGDNRANSADSSYGCQRNRPITDCQGPVPVDDVIGKAIVIVMPLSRWDTIGDPKIDVRPGR